jgi:hypothetical protein
MRLDVSRNHLRAAGTAALARGLAQNTSLTELVATHNQMSLDGAGNNDMSGIIALASALKTNRQLVSLDLSSSFLVGRKPTGLRRKKSPGADCIADFDEPNLEEVTSPDFSGLKALGEALEHNKTPFVIGKTQLVAFLAKHDPPKRRKADSFIQDNSPQKLLERCQRCYEDQPVITQRPKGALKTLNLRCNLIPAFGEGIDKIFEVCEAAGVSIYTGSDIHCF